MSAVRAIFATSRLTHRLAPVWIVLVVLTTCLTLIIAGVYATRLPLKQYERALWVGHTREVMEQLARLALHVTESEADQRGYLLTGNIDCLTSYRTSIGRVSSDLDRLHSLIVDNKLQNDRLRHLRQSIQMNLNALSDAIEQRQAANRAAGKPIATSGDSEHQMQLIREQINELWKEEQSLLQARTMIWEQAVSRAQTAVISSGFVIFVLISVTGLALWRLAHQQRKLTETERQIGNIQRTKAEKLMGIVMIQKEIAAHSLDLEFAMQAMTDHTLILTDAEGSIVETVEDDYMVYRAASGTAARHIGMKIKAAGSLSGRSVSQGVVLKCDDADTDERVDREACRRVGLRSMIVVPLVHKEQRLGVLKVLSSRYHAFDDDDVATLELLAGVLSGVFRDANGARLLRQLNDDLVAANVSLENLATTDGMTGLRNHRAFQETLAHEYQRARRSGLPLSLLLFDVDHFKKFNDTFGHPAGDAVLKRIGSLIQESTRVTDHAARYGGEEFAVLLPETDADGANTIAERIREAIASAPWELRSVTVSIGVSTLHPDCESGAQLVVAADQALYQSKHEGRNRVSHYDPHEYAGADQTPLLSAQ